MEGFISKLFDFQQFQQNERLNHLIEKTQTQYMGGRELSENELEWVSAAGVGAAYAQRELDEILRTKL